MAEVRPMVVDICSLDEEGQVAKHEDRGILFPRRPATLGGQVCFHVVCLPSVCSDG